MSALSRWKWTGKDSLADDDKEIMDLIRKEKERQKCGLELIASEVGALMQS